mgnify:CR=1 FL=1
MKNLEQRSADRNDPHKLRLSDFIPIAGYYSYVNRNPDAFFDVPKDVRVSDRTLLLSVYHIMAVGTGIYLSLS